MIEIIVRKMYIDAEYKKALTLADTVRSSSITSTLTSSEGDFADEMNLGIQNLNKVYEEFANAMDLCNAAIKNAADEFVSMDDLIAHGLKVTTGAK